ncbi:MAG TPA: hypothetical protein VJ901_04520, partial [Thermoanaerobaculia bacterium]|nr:hypothetical protein [Thermoanaerobaculia bacterium]
RSKLVHVVRTARETIEAVEVIVHKPLSAPATNERAESVHRALLASGIPESRITIKEGEFDGSTAIEVEIVRRRE